MPHPVAHFEYTLAAFLAPDRLAGVQIGDVRDFRADTQLGVLARGMDGGFQRAEVARELEVLVGRQMLVGKDQHRVTIERRFDFAAFFARQGFREVDIADLGGEAFGYGINGHWFLPLRLQVSGNYSGTGIYVNYPPAFVR